MAWRQWHAMGSLLEQVMFPTNSFVEFKKCDMTLFSWSRQSWRKVSPRSRISARSHPVCQGPCSGQTKNERRHPGILNHIAGQKVSGLQIPGLPRQAHRCKQRLGLCIELLFCFIKVISRYPHPSRRAHDRKGGRGFREFVKLFRHPGDEDLGRGG